MDEHVDIDLYLASVAALGLFLAVSTGCAAGEIAPGEECDSSSDCESDELCVEGTCVGSDANGGGIAGSGTSSGASTAGTSVGGNTAGAGSSTVEDGGNGSASDDDGGDGNATGGDVRPDAGVGCGGECGPGEECEEGSCVSLCDPECNSNQHCVQLEDGEEAQCLTSCSEAFEVSDCFRTGELCRDVNPDENETTLACVPSQCSSHSDCEEGSCLRFINEHGACVADGSKAVGESCDLSSALERCEQGAFCIQEGSNTNQGTCRTLCDPWNGSSCSAQERCSLFTFDGQGYSALTFRQGWCNPSLDSDGREPFEGCSSGQNMCNHAVRCSAGNDNFCFKWCRPGEGDCRGTIPDDVDTNGVCDKFVFGGLRKVGRCVPECSGSEFCSSGDTRCVNGICRQECSQGSAVADCCGGSSPCPYTCSSEGLCE